MENFVALRRFPRQLGFHYSSHHLARQSKGLLLRPQCLHYASMMERGMLANLARWSSCPLLLLILRSVRAVLPFRFHVLVCSNGWTPWQHACINRGISATELTLRAGRPDIPVCRGTSRSPPYLPETGCWGAAALCQNLRNL